MNRFTRQAASLSRQTAAEVRLFWRSHEAVYMTFLIPLLGMALFVYLNREGMLETVYGVLLRGLGSRDGLGELSPLVLMTLGIITYCIIAAAFEDVAPKLVRERQAGILKRLGGTPLPVWIFLAAKTISATLLILLEVTLILAVGIVSSDLDMAANWWLLAVILLLGTFTVAPLGYILASVVKSVDAAVMLVHAIYIPMLLLCGAFVPFEALPQGLQLVGRIFPLTYFVGPFRRVMTEGAGLQVVSGDLLVLVAWLVIGWLIAIRTFRWE